MSSGGTSSQSRAPSPSGSMERTLATPSTWPWTWWPPSGSPTRSAGSTLTWAPSSSSRSVVRSRDSGTTSKTSSRSLVATAVRQQPASEPESRGLVGAGFSGAGIRGVGGPAPPLRSAETTRPFSRTIPVNTRQGYPGAAGQEVTLSSRFRHRHVRVPRIRSPRGGGRANRNKGTLGLTAQGQCFEGFSSHHLQLAPPGVVLQLRPQLVHGLGLVGRQLGATNASELAPQLAFGDMPGQPAGNHGHEPIVGPSGLLTGPGHTPLAEGHVRPAPRTNAATRPAPTARLPAPALSPQAEAPRTQAACPRTRRPGTIQPAPGRPPATATEPLPRRATRAPFRARRNEARAPTRRATAPARTPAAEVAEPPRRPGPSTPGCPPARCPSRPPRRPKPRAARARGDGSPRR